MSGAMLLASALRPFVRSTRAQIESLVVRRPTWTQEKSFR
jgi:hypothetical protein